MSENNLTWDLGNYRVYVAEEIGGFRWNVRKNPPGWEIDGCADNRENAIIDALGRIEALEISDMKVEYRIILNTEDKRVQAKPSSTAMEVFLIANGMDKSVNMSRWEARTINGHHIPWNAEIHLFVDWQPIVFGLRAGIGG